MTIPLYQCVSPMVSQPPDGESYKQTPLHGAASVAAVPAQSTALLRPDTAATATLAAPTGANRLSTISAAQLLAPAADSGNRMTPQAREQRARQLIDAQLQDAGYSDLQSACDEALALLRTKKDPSQLRKLSMILAALPRTLMGVDGFDEASAAITINKVVEEALKSTILGSVFSILVGIGLYGAINEWMENKEAFNDLLGDIADIEQQLGELLDSDTAVADRAQQAQHLVKRHIMAVVRHLSPSYTPEAIAPKDQAKLARLLEQMDRATPEALPKLVEKYTELQIKLAQKQILKLDTQAAKALAVSMGGMLGAMLVSTAQGAMTLHAVKTSATALLNLSRTLADFVVPGIFLPFNLLASLAGKRVYQSGKLEQQRLEDAVRRLFTVENKPDYGKVLQGSALVDDASDHNAQLQCHNRREKIRYGWLYEKSQKGMAATGVCALTAAGTLAVPPVSAVFATIASIVGLPSAAVTIFTSLGYKTRVSIQAEHYRGDERVQTDSPDSVSDDTAIEAETTVAETAVNPLEKRKAQLAERLGKLAEKNPEIDAKLIGLKAFSMLNSAVQRQLTGNKRRMFIASGVKSWSQGTSFSAQQKHKLKQFTLGRNTAFAELLQRLDSADERLSQQLMMLQNLFAPQAFAEQQPPELLALTSQLLKKLDSVVVTPANHTPGKRFGLFKRKPQPAKTLLDHLGVSFASGAKAIKVRDFLTQVTQLETLRRKQTLSVEERTTLARLETYLARHRKGFEQYLYQGMRELFSTEKAYVKHDRFELFAELDALTQAIVDHEALSHPDDAAALFDCANVVERPAEPSVQRPVDVSRPVSIARTVSAATDVEYPTE